MQLTKSLLHTTDNYIQRLYRGGIETVEDLLLFFPRDLENTSNILESFAYVNIQEKNTIKVTLINILREKTKYQKNLTKFVVSDINGMLTECVFFHTPFFKKPLQL
jgi:RecG-like helicase